MFKGKYQIDFSIVATTLFLKADIGALCFSYRKPPNLIDVNERR